MKSEQQRIVITGIGLTSPIGNNLSELRSGLLEGRSGISHTEIRHMGIVAAGLCRFDETKHQSKKMRKRGTRAGAISVYCTKEALIDSQIDFDSVDKNRVGVYLGITEHGNVETENEIHDLYNSHNMDVSFGHTTIIQELWPIILRVK
jgi:3-oxoacyl-[acyl-carrier-protein] synthase II